MHIRKSLIKLIGLFLSKERRDYNKRCEKSEDWINRQKIKPYWWEKGRPGKYRYFMPYIQFRSWLTRKPWIVSIDWALTTYCTLACRDCSHFMTEFTKETHLPPISFEQYKRQLDMLLKHVDGIYNLQIVGGETLMVKDLPQIVDYTAKTGKVKHIIVITNGTMIPKPKLLEVMAKHKGIAEILISDYSSNKDLLPRLKYDELKKTLDDADVSYVEVFDKEWVGVPKYTPDFDRERARRYYSYETRECLFHQTLHLIDGMLAVCPFHGWGLKHGILNHIEPKEYIPLEELTTKKLYKWLAKPYYDLCGYCIVDCVPRPNAIQKEGMTCSH